MTATTIPAQRSTAVGNALAEVRRLLDAGGVSRDTLAQVAAVLERLAARPELFPAGEFPPPAENAGVGASTRYRLNPQDGEAGIALYLNSINPGKKTVPHNHDTWAVIVALSGDEHNRIYRRTDDGRRPGHATLAVEREQTVRPGAPIAFLPDDVHSIHVDGTQPTLHFHLYGQPLETLTGRVGYDLATGEVVNYNATQMRPSRNAAVR
ncbi:cysteine dioxygenase family protein [Xylophilus sp.]|uniref:cysteine dioxygenase family protein n=1 Tax=Xylophilus sp. TaxID=2653893 RepID=UPI0013B7C766|nr:cysteine dioxygenase family protein [Xylophilus sp.]KAF1044775.1 MAG: hypothetical protein GAK38_03375 [Xylophilus sp.]